MALGTTLAAMLSACGGGGSAPAPTTTTVIAQQQQTVAQLSRDQLRGVAANIYSDVQRAARMGVAAPATYEAARTLGGFGTMTYLCTSGSAGTLAVVATDQGTIGAIDAGDTVALAYQQCDLSSLGVASVVNGSQSLLLAEAVGTPAAGAAWSARVQVTWQGLTEDPSASTLTTGMDGTVTFTMSATAAGATTVSAQFDTLRVSDLFSGAGLPSNVPVATLTYENFTLSYVVDAVGARSTVQGRTVYAQPSAPGVSPVTMNYSTALAFRTDAGGVPQAGDITVTASALRPLTINGTTVSGLQLPATATFRWVVTAATTVRLDADENSDGVLESSQTFGFSELQ